MNTPVYEHPNRVRYEKLGVSLRYFLLGRGYYEAARALEFGAKYHTGTRKDGITPEFQHQIEICHYVRTLLPSLQYPEETLIAAILHDTDEDYPECRHELQREFTERTVTSVLLLNKHGKTKDHYFNTIAEDPIASIVKGADRTHNLQSMIGVFTAEKQIKYVEEVETYFLPMLKNARRKFPQQEPAYENVKHLLNTQIELIRELHAATVPQENS